MNEYQEEAYKRVTRLVTSEKHYKETDDDLQAQLRDLLTDIRHYAEHIQLDFYAAVDGSYDVYLEEREFPSAH